MIIVDYYAGKLGKSTAEVMAAAMILRTPVDGEPDHHAFNVLAWDESILGPKPTGGDLAEIDALPEPAAPTAVPEVISDRQFFQQLAVDGDITEDEALAAVATGTMPKKLADAIAVLPANQQIPAKMLCCGATEFRRSNPVVPVLGAALGKDDAALDAIWSAAATL